MTDIKIMGRTQSFDEDTVIQKAQEVFWKKGYNETSLDDIQKATGLHKGSLYRSFKSKENLFLLALNKYAAKSRGVFIKNEEPVAYLRQFFVNMIKECTSDSKGCFIMNTCVELGGGKDLLAKVSKTLFAEIENNFKEAIKMGQKQGEISKDIDVAEYSTRLVSAAFSIREFSKFNKGKERFVAIANGVLHEVGTKI